MALSSFLWLSGFAVLWSDLAVDSSDAPSPPVFCLACLYNCVNVYLLKAIGGYSYSYLPCLSLFLR